MRDPFQQEIDLELERLKTVALRLDALYRIPGTRLTVGLDNLLGLLPVIGDVAAMVPAVWLVWKARQLGASPGAIAFMIGNLAVDLIIGSVPVVGDIFDIAYNANIRNIRLLEKNIAKRAAQARTVQTASATEYSF